MANPPFEIKKLDLNQRGNSITLTVIIPVSKTVSAADAIKFANDPILKNLVDDARAQFGLSNYGIQKTGGAVPIREDGKLHHYEVDFRFTPRI